MTPILDLTVTAVVILVALVAYVTGHRNGHDDAIEEQEMRRKSWNKEVNGEARPPTQAPWEFKPQDLRKKEAA